MLMPRMFCEVGFGWRPQLDNPTFLGWSVVAFYGLAALACARAAILACANRDRSAQPGHERGCAGIWWALASVLCVLGVNKQLNLQTLLIAVGRRWAEAGGWTSQRRQVQLVFSLVFGLGLSLLLVWLGTAHRDFFKRHRRTFWGVLVLGFFVTLRAATINHADGFLGLNLNDKEWAWLLEICGSALIGIGAVQAPRSSET
jgi:hypothetical protein